MGVSSSNANLADFYEARVLSATDYYAFGMSMKERSFQAESYRYGFNGKENDTDWEVQDYGFRIYKPELGKFLSVDPLTKSYPWYTPYQFAGNQPIWAIDLDGLEEKIIINSRTVTDEFHKIRNSKGIEEAVSWLLINYHNQGWKNKNDVVWLQETRGVKTYGHPVYGNHYKIPDIVFEAFDTDEVGKGIEIYGLADIDKKENSNSVFYYKLDFVEPEQFKKIDDKIGEGFILLNKDGGGNGNGHESNTTADKITVIDNPVEMVGDIFKFFESLGIREWLNKKENPDGKEHYRDTTGWRGDGKPDTIKSFQYKDGTVQWNNPVKTVIPDPKKNEKKGDND